MARNRIRFWRRNESRHHYRATQKVQFSNDVPACVIGVADGRLSTGGCILGKPDLSIPALNKAWETKCSPTQKLVLLAIADRINIDTKVCYPSAEDICERTGLKKNAVWKSIKSLEQIGVLCVIRQHRKSNLYYLPALGIPQIPTSIQKRHKVVSKKQLPSIPGIHQSEVTGIEPKENQKPPYDPRKDPNCQNWFSQNP